MKGKKLYSFWLVWPKEKSNQKDGDSKETEEKEEESDDDEHKEGDGSRPKDLKQVRILK